MGWRRPLGGLLLLYCATRLFGLRALPMFLDESWHLSWSMWIAEGKEWEVPWQYGKGLSVFASALLFPWAEDAYLLAGRAVTVLFGALTLAAVFGAARRLYDDGSALAAAVLYVFCPYALFYDRLAMTDPVQSAFAALSLLLSVRLARSGRTGHALLLGLTLALSVFAKALGVLAFATPLLAWLLLAEDRRARLRAFASAGAVGAGLVAYPLWRFFALTSTVRAAIDKSDEGPVGRLLDNAPLAWDWVSSYWTLPLLALAAAGFAHALVRRSRPGLFLAGTIALPLFAFLAISTLWFPRYLVFLTPPLSILAGATLAGLLRAPWARLGRRTPPAWAWALALAAALLPALRFDARLWTDPARAPLPEFERYQFVTGWPSGYGTRDTLAFLREKLRERPGGLRVVLHSAARRTLAFALSVEFRYEGWLVVDDLRLDDPAAAAALLGWAREMPTFVVVPPPHRTRRPDAAALLPFVRLVLETHKPDGSLCDQVYEVSVPGRRADREPARTLELSHQPPASEGLAHHQAQHVGSLAQRQVERPLVQVDQPLLAREVEAVARVSGEQELAVQEHADLVAVPEAETPD